ncbi:MAG: asparagine synthase (glutamine-hydrolyzing), partial [Anaerolineales bacterium]|nr:asparagine synthase (glutamine-hydrolyzing) [Anaerolineales bacterium]
MCGITGVYHFTKEPVAESVLKKMNGAITHRGPDGEGIYINDNVGLGHRRLAIIDLSPTGHQPMESVDRQLVLTYNGEIYNFPELKTELEGLGYQFRSRSDSEVLLYAYKEWGIKALDKLNGMFAFAIWDEIQQQLFLARDRYGVKPLYYYANPSLFLFGSEIKAILAHPSISNRICLPALNEYFTFQNILTDLTLFEGIKILPAGHYLILSVQNPSLTPVQYWDYDFTGSITLPKEAATEELKHLFNQAVTRQLISDVPIGSYLSGGMDSGSITAVARQHLGRMTTFTGGFDLSSASGLELGFDERSK